MTKATGKTKIILTNIEELIELDSIVLSKVLNNITENNLKYLFSTSFTNKSILCARILHVTSKEQHISLKGALTNESIGQEDNTSRQRIVQVANNILSQQDKKFKPVKWNTLNMSKELIMYLFWLYTPEAYLSDSSIKKVLKEIFQNISNLNNKDSINQIYSYISYRIGSDLSPLTLNKNNAKQKIYNFFSDIKILIKHYSSSKRVDMSESSTYLMAQDEVNALLSNIREDCK